MTNNSEGGSPTTAAILFRPSIVTPVPPRHTALRIGARGALFPRVGEPVWPVDTSPTPLRSSTELPILSLSHRLLQWILGLQG
ncbi:uncharacterized protein VTP21DRAFT_2473 [Calcarisporiella thermophila]|uniref:uncharacterized protein n=1 Tax=Calcarisporiella thermophila TaxID=911321 RepID=UPI003744AD63